MNPREAIRRHVAGILARVYRLPASADVVDTDGAETPSFMLAVDVDDGTPSGAYFYVTGDGLAQDWDAMAAWADSAEVLDTRKPHFDAVDVSSHERWQTSLRNGNGSSMDYAIGAAIAGAIAAQVGEEA